MKSPEKYLIRHYGLKQPKLNLLEGYADKTYKVSESGNLWILKVHPERPGMANQILAEHRFMEALGTLENYNFPAHQKSIEKKVFISAEGYLLRLLTYIPGQFMSEITWPAPFLKSFGTFLAAVDKVGLGVDPVHIATKRFHWDLQHLLLNRDYLNAISEPGLRSRINYFFLQFELEVLPRNYALRRAIIHNDANENNVLVAGNTVHGIIDFGDMCYSWLINELAVGLTYVLMRSKNPLEDACTVIGAYNQILPLQEPELDVLYYLIAGRICISLCNSAHASLSKPESDYIRISEGPARELLETWLKINPAAARNAFRVAAGMEAASPAPLSIYNSRRDGILSKAYSLSYKQPIVMEKAAFQYMYDHKGNSFLDAYNNIMLVGHSHPEVVRAVCGQMGQLNTNTRYHYELLLEYGELLLSYFPKNLNKVFFVNSGSAATDLALRIARAHTQKQKILCLEQGYHGNTIAAVEVSPYKHQKAGVYPNAVIAPLPDWINSGFENEAAAAKHFTKTSHTIIAQHSGRLAGCITEPIMGCGGQLPLPKGYLPELYQAIRQAGGVCICDEVQIGFGRLGHFKWGFEMMDVNPDMVILGKPMGNGHPIGAVVTTAELAATFEEGPEFFSSFGGNPVSCAAGLAVLQTITREGLQEHAAETGDFLMGLLEEVRADDARITDVRGSGLFLGVELREKDGGPGTQLASDLKNYLRGKHILVGTDGPFDSVLKIKPPLPFNRQNSQTLVAEIRRFLKKTSLNSG